MPENSIGYVLDQNSRAFGEVEDLYRREVQARQSAYAMAWNYYYGQHRKHLAPDNTNTDDNLIINLIELLIDKAVSGLMGTTEQGAIKGPDFEVVDPQAEDTPMMQRAARGVMRMMGRPQEQPDSPAQEYIERVWEANAKPLFLHDLATNGGVCGTLFVKIVPDGLPDPDNPGATVPRYISLNPAYVTPFWNADDVDTTSWYRIQYGKEPDQTRQDIVYDEQRGVWIIYDFKEQRGTPHWLLIATTDWRFEWAPIVEWKNLPRPNDHYGLNDIRSAGGLNDGLNFVASNTQRIIKYHAFPNTVATGTSADKIEPTGVDRLWAIPAPDARVYNIEMQSDLASSLNFMQFVRRAVFDSGRELDPSTVADKLGAVTNFGLRVLFRDSLEKIGTKRLLYGAGLRKLCQYTLELGGFGANIKVVDKWPDPLPTDPLATAQALQLDRANGLSQDTYLEKRGFDPDEEAKRRERERGETVMDQTIQRQGSLVDQMRGQMPQGMGINDRPTATNARMDGRGNQRNG